MEFNFGDNPILLAVASSMVGLLPLLITITVDQLEKRSLKSRRDANLNYLNQRVAFITAWFNAQKEICNEEQLKPVREKMIGELKEIYDEFAYAVLEEEKGTIQRHELMQRVNGMSFFKRLLLLYKPFNIRGWLFHALFYMCVTPLVIVLGFVVYSRFQSEILIAIPSQFLLTGIILSVLAILFHWLGRASAKGIEEDMAILDRKTTPRNSSASA